tara:strand:- start:374 stop:940 length:567 start_codon:yes stop_codon:yes gene_type:complete
MEDSTRILNLGGLQKSILLIVAILLTSLIVFLRIEYKANNPLDLMARSSLDLNEALTNGKPTLVEFYADWCEICREMAPSIIALEKAKSDKLNFVMLNVENNYWEDLLEEYDVNGIPQLIFFNSNGEYIAKSIGKRSGVELNEISEDLLNNRSFPAFNGVQINSLQDNLAYKPLNISSKLETKPMDHN